MGLRALAARWVLLGLRAILALRGHRVARVLRVSRVFLVRLVRRVRRVCRVLLARWVLLGRRAFRVPQVWVSGFVVRWRRLMNSRLPRLRAIFTTSRHRSRRMAGCGMTLSRRGLTQGRFRVLRALRDLRVLPVLPALRVFPVWTALMV